MRAPRGEGTQPPRTCGGVCLSASAWPTVFGVPPVARAEHVIPRCFGESDAWRCRPCLSQAARTTSDIWRRWYFGASDVWRVRWDSIASRCGPAMLSSQPQGASMLISSSDHFGHHIPSARPQHEYTHRKRGLALQATALTLAEEAGSAAPVDYAPWDAAVALPQAIAHCNEINTNQ